MYENMERPKKEMGQVFRTSPAWETGQKRARVKAKDTINSFPPLRPGLWSSIPAPPASLLWLPPRLRELSDPQDAEGVFAAPLTPDPTAITAAPSPGHGSSSSGSVSFPLPLLCELPSQRTKSPFHSKA